MDDVEIARPACKTVCKMLGWSKPKFWREKRGLLHAGVVYYDLTGFPSHRVLMCWPSMVKKYAAMRSDRDFVPH